MLIRGRITLYTDNFKGFLSKILLLPPVIDGIMGNIRPFFMSTEECRKTKGFLLYGFFITKTVVKWGAGSLAV